MKFPKPKINSYSIRTGTQSQRAGIRIRFNKIPEKISLLYIKKYSLHARVSFRNCWIRRISPPFLFLLSNCCLAPRTSLACRMPWADEREIPFFIIRIISRADKSRKNDSRFISGGNTVPASILYYQNIFLLFSDFSVFSYSFFNAERVSWWNCSGERNSMAFQCRCKAPSIFSWRSSK